MLVKYSLGLPGPSVICLSGWVLLIPQIFCATVTCPPPDFPERGRYEPVKSDYEVGQTIAYHCDPRLPMIDAAHNWLRKLQVATCEPSGKWSRETPFCDVPAKLKNPITYSKELESAVLDGDDGTCAPTRNLTEEFLQFSLDPEAAVYATIMCWRNGIKTIKISGSVWQSEYKANSYLCGVDTYRKTEVKTENVTVQISSESASSIELCVVEVFTRDDKWCGHPPLISVPNGQLEVGRSKAILHCNKGFEEKDGRKAYAVCENNKWSYNPNLQCRRIGRGQEEGDDKPETDDKVLDGKPETDYKALAIVFGCMVVILILIFFGSKMFLILRKRTKGVVVRYNPGVNNYSSSPLCGRRHSTTDRPEPECIYVCDVNESKTSKGSSNLDSVL